MVSKIEMILLFMSISPQCRFFIFAKKESASDTRRLFFLWAGKLLPASRECADFNTYPRCSLRAWRAFFYKTENRIRLREHASPPLRALGAHRALGALFFIKQKTASGFESTRRRHYAPSVSTARLARRA